jgi:rhamnogalacturonyl hydrolase YesR
MTAHMPRTDVTDGTLERAFTALVYNGVSNGLWHTILLNPKNHIKTGGLAGRVQAARSDKKIVTIESRIVLIWNMKHSQDNGIHTSVGFEVSRLQ